MWNFIAVGLYENTILASYNTLVSGIEYLGSLHIAVRIVTSQISIAPIFADEFQEYRSWVYFLAYILATGAYISGIRHFHYFNTITVCAVVEYGLHWYSDWLTSLGLSEQWFSVCLRFYMINSVFRKVSLFDFVLTIVHGIIAFFCWLITNFAHTYGHFLTTNIFQNIKEDNEKKDGVAIESTSNADNLSAKQDENQNTPQASTSTVSNESNLLEAGQDDDGDETATVKNRKGAGRRKITPPKPIGENTIIMKGTRGNREF